jgi:hypothetical protein
VQSLDETVLKNVKRSTIKLEAYEQLLMYIRGRGLRSNSDLILGLPGETLESHVSSIHKLLDGGASQVTNFQLLLLKGSELETLESRQQFKFTSRFRIGPKNFGVYGGEKVMDIEEVVVETDTLTFDDYLESRKYALVSAAYWHDNLLENILSFAQSFGVRRSQWLDRVLSLMEGDAGEVRQYLDNFIQETRNELHLTKEALFEAYSREESFPRLLRGEIGDNLMHKYRAIASFHIWPEICDFGAAAARQLLEERDIYREIPDFQNFWRSLVQFVLCSHAHGRTIEEVVKPGFSELAYDIPRWLSDGAPKNPAPYRLAEPQVFEFKVSETGERELRKAFQVWTSDLKGLSKLVTRIQLAWQVRESAVTSEVPRTAAAAVGA